MKCEEWDDANSELFKESHDEAVHKNSYKSRRDELISASLGHFLPALPRFPGRLQIDGISLPMAVLIGVMIDHLSFLNPSTRFPIRTSLSPWAAPPPMAGGLLLLGIQPVRAILRRFMTQH